MCHLTVVSHLYYILAYVSLLETNVMDFCVCILFCVSCDDRLVEVEKPSANLSGVLAKLLITVLLNL